MSRDATGIALSVMNTLAGSELIDRLGLRKTIERVAYRGTKGGFELISAASRPFNQLKQLSQPVRLDKPADSSGLFDLSITDEQQMIRDNVRRFAENVLRAQAAKADEDCRLPKEILHQAQELGLAYYAVPEALGGAGTERSPITTMLVAEDLAWGDMGLAWALLSSLSSANALTHWGSAAQQEKFLPAFLDESKPLQAAIAVNEPTPLFDPMKLSCKAQSNAQGYLLNGEKSVVPLAQDAELFLVAAKVLGKGPAVFLVKSDSEGLSLKADRGMGLRAGDVAKLVLKDVQVSKDDLLGMGELDYQSFIDYSRLGWCAMALGTCQAVLDYVIPYCNEREAFGEPISHRQSVAFMIANIGIELEGMRLLTQRAVARAEQGQDFHREAYIARVGCAEKAMEIGTNGVQLLGGHGFTKEHPVERWYRDLRAIGIMEGGMHL